MGIFRRHKRDDVQAQVPAPEQSYWATHPEGQPEPQADPALGQLLPDVAALLRAAGTDGAGVTRTTVSTSLTQNGKPVDPDSPEGQRLLAMLGHLDGKRVFTTTTRSTVEHAQPVPAAAPGPDRQLVAAALAEAQANGGAHLNEIATLVERYLGGQLDTATFQAERQRIMSA